MEVTDPFPSPDWIYPIIFPSHFLPLPLLDPFSQHWEGLTQIPRPGILGITSWILWDHCGIRNNVLILLGSLPLPPFSLLSVPSPLPPLPLSQPCRHPGVTEGHAGGQAGGWDGRVTNGSVTRAVTPCPCPQCHHVSVTGSQGHSVTHVTVSVSPSHTCQCHHVGVTGSWCQSVTCHSVSVISVTVSVSQGHSVGVTKSHVSVSQGHSVSVTGSVSSLSPCQCHRVSVRHVSVTLSMSPGQCHRVTVTHIRVTGSVPSVSHM